MQTELGLLWYLLHQYFGTFSAGGNLVLAASVLWFFLCWCFGTYCTSTLVLSVRVLWYLLHQYLEYLLCQCFGARGEDVQRHSATFRRLDERELLQYINI